MNLLSNTVSRILSLDTQLSNSELESTIPRPDLRCSLAQFDIALLTTVLAPRDEDDWFRLYQSPPGPEELEEKFAPFADLFELQSNDCAFMQDLDQLDGANELPVEKLFMDMLRRVGHFVKSGRIKGISPFWAAIALYGLQTNACGGGGGGGGYHTSLRGAGPLTTLILPHHRGASRWQTLWLNVLTQEHIDQLPGDPNKTDRIFPWSYPTRTADQGKTLPQHTHPLQVLWGMPRRIRLVFDNGGGRCDLTGERCSTLVTGFRTKTQGTDYGDYWVHPHSPYETKKSIPSSIKGEAESITYHHWCGLALPNERAHRNCAQVVSAYLHSRAELINDNGIETRLWVSGYDMSNAKARCWYETTMPLYTIPAERREWVADFANTLTKAASSCSKKLNQFVKDPALSKKSKAKPDLDFIGSTLMERTEAKFFQFLKQMIACDDPEEASVELKDRWRSHVGREAIAIFDAHVLATTETPTSLAGLANTREEFLRALWGLKTMKTLKKPEDNNGQT